MSHPTIEYLYQPARSYRRFGHTISYNRWSMRSRDFPRARGDEHEIRVMVLGDSVIDGGAPTDQDDLATTILEGELAAEARCPVVVGNISAGGWGPPNCLAYAKEYGLFDADIVIFVVSSHDAADVHGAAPLNPYTHPQSPPPFALWEAITRYGPKYTYNYWQHRPDATKDSDPIPENYTPLDSAKVAKSMAAVKELIAMVKDCGAQTIVLQHWTCTELSGGAGEGHDLILRACQATQTPVYQLSDWYRPLIAEGRNPFRDDIHLNPVGQRALASAMYQVICAHHWPAKRTALTP